MYQRFRNEELHDFESQNGRPFPNSMDFTDSGLEQRLLEGYINDALHFYSNT